ncbi:aldehyde dehydrogenase [Gluconobacter thailandicus F149-1 = NBRC 100600]|uniref:Betaine-aldehyde dehydrogenase n=1 Tax=Gluconobacter thailandicus NBRC 3257 TaxID=1381097 RepID=A0ABQ0IZG6_GLUTH|nr:aldehyde dehydrogenase family protein [Gluconobacter thailandicus]KXV53515.1 aldehyde dehydrogenase [Gluconobacter thailandicus]GAC88409.1 betaine-aldehyde dehydrogenase [Gluconobacter thailandicus NBRC 3255]GAD27587.1 betaine-aldehyde dehydrogenase [Gluconobacter thailandicus NBRC 3257]GAN91933.1 aldehyde dehydrogenase [Gluconobacter thailandicus F149-1 = NBRC 100600]GBR61631.1 NAD-dependent aldehyde dehydrogenase [Gluconobacter thailandicus F149-1 = NBRC 100600]
MMTGITFDPTQVALPNAHFVGGKLLKGEGATPVHTPSDGRLLCHLPEAGADLVDHAVCLAQDVQIRSGWATCAPRERGRVLRRWADLVEQNAVELARLETVCSTRPIAETTAWDVPFTAEGIRFFSEYADKLGGEVAATQSDLLGMVLAEPYGVIGAIAPWNFPLVMGSWKVIPALAAGNGVVLKPSEMTPFSIIRLAELAVEAGVPAGLFNVVQGTGPITGDALARHPVCGKLTFTGSTRTGIEIMKAAAESGPKPVTLELGGKSPQIVFDDIRDADAVADRILRAFTGNAGQVCVSGSRLIVQKGVHDVLLEKIIERAQGFVSGSLEKAETRYSPIISERQAASIEAAVHESMQAGASALLPLNRLSSPGGVFLSPCILSDVTPQTRAVKDELFGPVLTVQTFDDEAEAFALASHATYGLAAGVHTADLGRAMRAVRNLKAGTVWVNRYGRSSDFVIPTGGYGGSGIGKDLGRQAVEANLRYKSVLMAFEG